MEYIMSLHAKERIERRKISMDVLEGIIRQPDDKIEETACVWVFQKMKENDKFYLYRVYVNICKMPPLVITAYKTSKIEKYGYKI